MFKKSSLRPLLSLVLGMTLAASACGIATGDDDQSANSDEGIGADTSQNSEGNTDTEGTDSNDADPSDSVAAPTTTSEVQPVADQDGDEVDPAFCDASAEYWVASNASTHVDTSRPGEVSMLYQLMETRLDEAIAAAPNNELAEPALVAREHFTLVYAAVSDARFDLDLVQDSPDWDDLQPSLQTLIDIGELLGTYLVGPCGYSADELNAGAESTASDIGRLVTDVLADSGDDDGDYTGDYIEVVDSTDRLKVEVPIDWEDIQSEPSGSGSALTAAPDVAAYLTSWSADGVKMTVTTAADPVDWRAPMYETNASAECTLVSSEPYSDELYTGWIDRYDNCAGGQVSAVVVGATDEEFSVEILVEVQFDNVDTQNDEATLSQILNTFKAR